MLWDTHMHSQFSGDSHTPLETMIQASIAKGLDGICFTDHLDLDYPDDSEEFFLDLPNYASSVIALKEKYKERFPILFGIELGLQTHLTAILCEIVSQYPFDFVIGSSHTVNGYDPYFSPYWNCHEEEDGYREYFSTVLENIKVHDEFDVYGHIDYVVRYGPNKNQFYTYEKYADLIDPILKLLIEKGKGIEINTSGFKYGLKHPNPTEEVITRYHELGGEIITTGADAHAPEHIAYDFEKIPEILKNAGFRYYTVFKERKPVFIKL